MRTPTRVSESGAFRELKRKLNEVLEYARAGRLSGVQNGRLNVTSSGTFLTVGKAKKSSESTSSVICGVIKNATLDGILSVRRLTDLTGNSEDWLRVVMPYSLHKLPWDGKPYYGQFSLFYASNSERQIRKVGLPTSVALSQFVWPPYVVETGIPRNIPPKGSIIYIAKPEGGTGVWTNGSMVIVDATDPGAINHIDYVDLNVDARQWTSEVQDYLLCQNDIIYTALFNAGQKIQP